MARTTRAKSSKTEAPETAAAPASSAPPTTDGVPYTVLARRYRSRDFDELVGQEAIVQTLRNAITQGRVAHAYLFTGTRGVGKTSAARLLASTLNATSDLAERDAVATAILRGEDIDVVEIDAASNTGVDNVRDLIANSTFMPARSPYKIYIIDEVHMLSKGAFNALLKTMEEPPKHVKFILCTTEAHKVPATIQSRCQRFDFRAIPAARIAEHLRNVLSQEGVAYEDAVVLQVSRLANGSMRDALSLLDRILAAADTSRGGAIDGALVERLLGLPESTVVHALAGAIADGDPSRALVAGEELLQHGNTYEQAIEALAEQFRTLMIAGVCGGESPLLTRFGEARDAAVELARRFEPSQLVHMIALCENAARAARASNAPRAMFDALIVRLALASQLLAASAAGGGAPRSGDDEKKKPLAELSAAPTPATMPSPSAPTTPTPTTSAPATPPAASRTPDAPEPASQDIASLWAAVVAAATSRLERSLVHALAPVALRSGQMVLDSSGAEPGVASLLRSSNAISELVHRATGRRWSVVIEHADDDRQAASTNPAPTARSSSTANSHPPAGRGTQPGPRPAPAGRTGGARPASDGSDAVRNHPLVREACEVFDAVIVSSERRSPGREPPAPNDPTESA